MMKRYAGFLDGEEGTAQANPKTGAKWQRFPYAYIGVDPAKTGNIDEFF
jgi:hypothetical protein